MLEEKLDTEPTVQCEYSDYTHAWHLFLRSDWMELQQYVFRPLSEPAVPWRESVCFTRLNSCA